jgi:hypothetical protein
MVACMQQKGKLTTSQSDTSASPRRLVHLTEHQGDLGLAIKLNDGGLLHFVVQIVALTSTLTNTSEDGVTTVSLGDVVLSMLARLGSGGLTYDQLLNEHSLADTSTTEQTNLTTTSVRSEKIDDLDTGNQDFGSGGLFDEFGSRSMDGSELGGLDGSSLVNRITSDVHDTTKRAGTDRNLNGRASILGLVSSNETLGTFTNTSADRVVMAPLCSLTVHGNTSDDILAQMLLLSSVKNLLVDSGDSRAYRNLQN